MPYTPFFFNVNYLLIVFLPTLVLGLIAKAMVSNAYRRYGNMPNARGITGAAAAENLLMYNNLGEVKIEGTPGELTDHYDPRSDVLRLSAGIARTPSIASLGVVAHEVGHAQQAHEGYAPMKLRSALVPAANIGSTAGPWLVILGLILQISQLAWAGVILFGAAALFYLVTLPVELNASRRGLAMLEGSGLVVPQEVDGARTMLRAAAFTYVAALLTALLQLFYFIMLLAGGGRRRR